MRMIARIFCCVALGCCVGVLDTWAQFKTGAEDGPSGPGTYRLEAGAVGATGRAAPFWLHANQYGTLGRRAPSGYVRAAARRRVRVGPHLTYEAGGELVGRASARSSVHLGEAYVGARYGFLRAYLGRKRETIGTTAGSRLSVGSLGTSSNATPVPKVALATTGYVGVPFTRGLVEVKGYWAEGRFGSSRFVEGAFLHQKTGYVRLGGTLPVRVYGGLVHNALWGGTSPRHGALPASFGDYLRTVVALNAGEEAPEGEQAYIQGDHLGMYDIGLEATIGAVELQVYRHFIYEDRDNLKLKSPQDGLFGVVARWERGLVRQVSYEHLYTKWQNGPIGPDGSERGGHGGRDNYYNHYIYRSGWTYHGRTIGTPLLTPAPDTEDGRRGVENNRVVGHHVGLAGRVGAGVRYRALATYTRNYGLYEAPYEARRDRYALLVETQVPLPGRYGLELLAGVAADWGAHYDNAVGARLGLVHRGTW